MNAPLCDLCLADGKVTVAAGRWGMSGMRIHICADHLATVPRHLQDAKLILDYTTEAFGRSRVGWNALNAANRTAWKLALRGVRSSA